MMNLPEQIQKIIIDYQNSVFAIGDTDVKNCTELEISFKDDIWTVTAARGSRKITKKYKHKVCDNCLTEIKLI
jgi:hypothetical protein